MRNVFTSRNFRLVFFGALVSDLGSTALLLFCTIGFTVTALELLFNKKVKEI
ncbi:MAG: hypothetical protein J5589_00490 [Firmicutes bacterium]|nr:hypothetical protein [Bacillota bacterium]